MKTFIPLENNPEVLTQLAHQLGVSQSLAFHDVYSFDDTALLSHIPRPAYALLVIIPLTATWEKTRIEEESSREAYTGSGPQEPVVWVKQTIIHACGLYGVLYCVCNGPAADYITPGSDLERLLQQAIPLKPTEREELVYNSEVLEKAHRAVATKGDSAVSDSADGMGHFVAFVKAKDGHLWELEGARKGPVDRGLLGEEDDVLSEKALDLGVRSILQKEKDAGGKDLRFSCIALSRSID